MKISLRPAGFILHEAMMAVALSLALIACIAQVLAMVARQRVLGHQHAVALREAGNLMEDLVSRRWSETAAGQPAPADLSEACSRSLPDAVLAVEVRDDGDDVRRISVRIEWGRGSGRAAKAVQLVGWKFRNEEQGP
jgi:hypothetical protein